MLSSAGYAVDTVRNGAAAVEAAAAQDYDAILMDCQMPELNGYEATAPSGRQEGAGSHTPIIALTAGAAGRTGALPGRGMDSTSPSRSARTPPRDGAALDGVRHRRLVDGLAPLRRAGSARRARAWGRRACPRRGAPRGAGAGP